MFFLNFVSFFLLWKLVYVFQSFVSIFAKKSDRTRCLAVSILEYNLGPKITGSEVQYYLEFEVGRASESVEERNSVEIHRLSETSEHRRPGLSNILNQWTFMTCK